MIPISIKYRVKQILKVLNQAQQEVVKSVLIRVWFTKGKVRTSLYKPYRGIRFEISPLFLSRRYVFFSAHEKLVTPMLREIVQPGMLIYVVGAHAGIHTLYIAKLLQGRGQVYAFEGWPENYMYLERNIALNHHLGTEIIPIPMAVGSTTTRAVMSPGSSDGTHHIARSTDQANHTVDVPITSLDDFATQNQHEPNFILIDVEGHEVYVLEGAKQLIERCKPALLVEVHFDHVDRDQFVDCLTAKHYTVKWIDHRHLYAHYRYQ